MKKTSIFCKHCGCEIKNPHKNQKYCSGACKRASRQIKTFYEKECLHCGIKFKAINQKQKYCSNSCKIAARRTGRAVYEKTCLYCKKVFHTIYKNQKYCSSACGSRHKGELRRGNYYCEYCGKPRRSDHPNRNRFCSRECAYKARRLINLKRGYLAKEAREQKLHKKCPTCGKEFIASVTYQKYCSLECRLQYALNKNHKECEDRFIPRTFVCIVCGAIVTTELRHRKQLYCSERCLRKLCKRMREQQIREAFIESVDIWDIYERDGGICGICGLPVPDTVEPSNQWAATVDHIIPLTQKGLHKKSNCQLAHRMCNSIKCDNEGSFKIDWSQKLKDEPGKWNDKLDNLWEQIDGNGVFFD